MSSFASGGKMGTKVPLATTETYLNDCENHLLRKLFNASKMPNGGRDGYRTMATLMGGR